MLGRRLLIFVAVLMGLAALAAAVAPREPTVAPSPSEPAARPEIEARGGPPQAAAAGEPRVQRMDAGGEGQALEAAVGERIRLEVATRAPVSVQVGEGGPLLAADPAAPARFNLRYENPVQRPVRVLGNEPGEQRVVGVVRVR